MESVWSDCVVVEDCGTGSSAYPRYRVVSGAAHDVIREVYGRWLALPQDGDGDRPMCEPRVHLVDFRSGDLVEIHGVRVSREAHYSRGDEVYRVSWLTPDRASQYVMVTVECALCWQRPALSPDELIAAHDARRLREDPSARVLGTVNDHGEAYDGPCPVCGQMGCAGRCAG